MLTESGPWKIHIIIYCQGRKCPSPIAKELRLSYNIWYVFQSRAKHFRKKMHSDEEKYTYKETYNCLFHRNKERLKYHWSCCNQRKNALHYIHCLTISTTENGMGLQTVGSWLRRTIWHSCLDVWATWHITGLLQCIVLHCCEECSPLRGGFWH